MKFAGAEILRNWQLASRPLIMITPIVLLMIFLLLYTSFKSTRLALLIYLAVPMAASGGIFALKMRGMPFSISAGVGFIALFGVAVLNGLVWVSAGGNIFENNACRCQMQLAKPRYRVCVPY